MGLFKKLFGDSSSRELKSIYPIVDKIEALGDEYKAMTDAQLQAKTVEFKERLANGETLDDILPEAFATAREAADRVLGMRPYRVQLVGGIVLHQGRIAEMKTGEGKTLVATLPAYLNALTGKGVKIRGEGSDQSFTFTGFHFGNSSLMQDYTANNLNGEVTHLKNSPRSLSYRSKSLGKNIVKGFAVFKSFFKFFCFTDKLTVGKSLKLFFIRENFVNNGLYFL